MRLCGLAHKRKNWIHVGSEEAGAKMAAILSIRETRKRRKINAREYLDDVLSRLASWNSSSIAKMTSMGWQLAHQKAA